MIIPLSLVVSQKSTMGLEYTGNTKVCVFASSSIDSRHLSSLSRLSDDMVIVVVFVVVVRLSFFSVPFQPGMLDWRSKNNFVYMLPVPRCSFGRSAAPAAYCSARRSAGSPGSDSRAVAKWVGNARFRSCSPTASSVRTTICAASAGRVSRGVIYGVPGNRILLPSPL